MGIFVSKKKNFSFYHNKKALSLVVNECSFVRKGFGLIFRTRNTENLLFSFSKDINHALTSWFVFFSFLAIWLDSEDKVIGFRLVKPFNSTIYSPKKFRKVLELPLNRDNMRLIRFLVGKGKV